MLCVMRLILSFVLALFSLASFGEKMIVDVYSLRAFEEPSKTSRFMYELGEGTEVEVLENMGEWSKINLNGKIRYVASDPLRPSQEMIDAGLVPAWKIPGDNHRKYQSFGWFFSTDRIMEALPPFNVLEGHIPFDTEFCFDLAVSLLLLSFLGMFFIYKRIRYGNIYYWIVYAVSMIIGVSELLYIFGSPDPLGYCDVENVSIPTAIFYVFLTGLGLYQQLKLYSTVLFVAQGDTDFNFHPEVATKLLLLVTVYFIAVVIARHFFQTAFPEYVSWCVLGLLAIPLLQMIIGLRGGNKMHVFLAVLPFYIVMTAASLALYCLIGVAIFLLTVIGILLKLAMHESTVDVKYKGVWYYTDYDTWFEGQRLGLWQDSVFR